MTLKGYVRLWIFISLLLVYECWALNQAPGYSISAAFKTSGVIPELNLSPDPGRAISVFYGWTGFGLMLLTNLYVLRKRSEFLGRFGSSAGWLNFHILCGLLGPTFIVFHTNFKVGGLVAISFWSMVVSFSSGIVGRYFYIQLVGQKAELDREVERCAAELKQFKLKGSEKVERTQTIILEMAGASAGAMAAPTDVGVLGALVNTLTGDLRLRLGFKRVAGFLPSRQQELLRSYAISKRRSLYLEQFRQLMGYWHSFHMPFAVFMYVVAVIHIVTALLLGVGDPPTTS